MACAFELQEILNNVTGMKAVSLTQWQSQGEFAGCCYDRAYHQARNDLARVEMLVPDCGAWYKSSNSCAVRF